MSYLLTPARWRRQPPRGTLLNLDHGLLRDQVTHAFAWDHRWNLINGVAPTLSGGWVTAAVPGGIGFDGGYGVSVNDHYSSGTYVSFGHWTVACVIVPYNTATPSGGIMIHGNGRLSGDGCNALYFNTSKRYGGWVFSGGAVTLDSPNDVVTPGAPQTVVFSVQPYSYNLYVDGKLQASTSGSETGRSWTTWNVASGYSAPDTGLSASLPLILRVTRAWSAEDALRFARNPWDIFIPARKFFFAAAAATGGSFNAAWACGSNAVIQPGAMQ